MGFYRGTNITNDGLIWAYDTGYPIVSGSADSYKFNLGEPTTNLSNTDAARTITLRTSVTGSVSDAPEKGDGWKKVTIEKLGTTKPLQFPYIFNMPSGSTYTFSVEYDFGSNTNYYWRIDGTLNSDGDTSIDDGTRISKTYTIINSGSYALFVWNTTDDINATVNDTLYYRYYQVEEKPHATPYTPTSRSASGSLFELTSRQGINLSNVSFDDNAQMYFVSESVNYIDTGITRPSPSTEPTTYELVWKGNRNSPVNNGVIGASNYNVSGFGIGVSSAGTDIIRYLYNAVGQAGESNVTYDYRVLSHGVFIFNGRNVKVYRNGELVANDTKNFDADEYAVTQRVSDCRQGGWPPGSNNIPVARIYNRALTEEEIQRNYNVYKYRFNLD